MNLKEMPKENVIEMVRLHENDRGSYPVQIAVLSHEIALLSEHIKVHKQDIFSLKGLKQKINNRKKFLKKYRSVDPEACAELVKKLNGLGIRL